MGENSNRISLSEDDLDQIAGGAAVPESTKAKINQVQQNLLDTQIQVMKNMDMTSQILRSPNLSQKDREKYSSVLKGLEGQATSLSAQLQYTGKAAQDLEKLYGAL